MPPPEPATRSYECSGERPDEFPADADRGDDSAIDWWKRPHLDETRRATLGGDRYAAATIGRKLTNRVRTASGMTWPVALRDLSSDLRGDASIVVARRRICLEAIEGGNLRSSRWLYGR